LPVLMRLISNPCCLLSGKAGRGPNSQVTTIQVSSPLHCQTAACIPENGQLLKEISSQHP
jgi:hypothetical protein